MLVRCDGARVDLESTAPSLMPQELAKRCGVLDVILGGVAVALHLIDESDDKYFEVHTVHDSSVGLERRRRGQIQFSRLVPASNQP